jgi:histone arginine demethylase JMJD6
MEQFKSVEKKDNITYDEFVEEHVKKCIPVVFKNASSAWKTNKIFTPDFFRERFGKYETWSGGIKYTMEDILDITAKSTPENPSPYPLSFEIPEQLPELMEMLDPIHMNYAQPNWFRSKIIPYGKFGNNIHLSIGGNGSQYSLHNDMYHTNAWITQLYGTKKFVVFPPGQDEYLYPGENVIHKFISPINILSPDYEKYPLYKNATPIEVVLQPRETIYIPNGVWHTTAASEQNISLIFDQLNGLNYPAWKKDIFEFKVTASKFKAVLHYSFALGTGFACQLLELFGNEFNT